MLGGALDCIMCMPVKGTPVKLKFGGYIMILDDILMLSCVWMDDFTPLLTHPLNTRVWAIILNITLGTAFST